MVTEQPRVVCVLGAAGYIGRHMVSALRKQTWIDHLYAYDRHGWDITRTDVNLLGMVGGNPDADVTIINCAGMADMDRAETDYDYAMRMHRVNTAVLRPLCELACWDLRHGRFVQISSPFVWDVRSRYAQCKRDADILIRTVCSGDFSSLLVYPGWLYGGEDSPQIDGGLKRNLYRPMTVDNVKVANPTHIQRFCLAVTGVIKRRFQGSVTVYEPHRMTACGLARNLLGLWGPHWTAGEYQDIAYRPKDWSFNGRFHCTQHFRILSSDNELVVCDADGHPWWRIDKGEE